MAKFSFNKIKRILDRHNIEYKLYDSIFELDDFIHIVVYIEERDIIEIHHAHYSGTIKPINMSKFKRWVKIYLEPGIIHSPYVPMG